MADHYFRDDDTHSCCWIGEACHCTCIVCVAARFDHLAERRKDLRAQLVEAENAALELGAEFLTTKEEASLCGGLEAYEAALIQLEALKNSDWTLADYTAWLKLKVARCKMHLEGTDG